MEKRFGVLRIIGTLWKILAWIELIVGTLSAFGVLLMGILGSGSFLLQFLGERANVIPGAMGLVSSIVAFIALLVGTIVYFLVLYAVGELIFLMLAIEENTRETRRWLEQAGGGGSEQAASPPPTS
jgi:hypothetical protein